VSLLETTDQKKSHMQMRKSCKWKTERGASSREGNVDGSGEVFLSDEKLFTFFLGQFVLG
jgi:hypothetical protein